MLLIPIVRRLCIPYFASIALVLVSSACQSKDQPNRLQSRNNPTNTLLLRNPAVDKQIYELTRKRKFALAKAVCKRDIEAINRDHDVNKIGVRHVLADRYWSMARINQGLKRTNESEECYKKAVSLWPDLSLISYEYGHFLIDSGKLELGIRVIEETKQAEEKEKSMKMAL